jgi:hypothetical protein
MSKKLDVVSCENISNTLGKDGINFAGFTFRKQVSTKKFLLVYSLLICPVALPRKREEVRL